MRREDIELRRNDEVFLDAQGTERIPDPTTAGDFCRRFAESHIRSLMQAIDVARLRVWARQPKAFFRRATIDCDARLVVTTGECKEGMDISSKGTWGCHPLVVSLAETGEVLWLLNRAGNRPSHEGAAAESEQKRWQKKHRQERQELLRMEFRTFLSAFIKLPCQIVRTGRKRSVGCWLTAGTCRSSSVSASPCGVEGGSTEAGVWTLRSTAAPNPRKHPTLEHPTIQNFSMAARSASDAATSSVTVQNKGQHATGFACLRIRPQVTHFSKLKLHSAKVQYLVFMPPS